MRLRAKLTGAILFSVLLTSSILAVFTILSLLRLGNESTSITKTALLTQYDNAIKSHVEILITELNAIQASIQEGVLTDDEGKLISANLIREAKYGTSGYFWADDLEGNNIVLLGRADVEGTNRLELKDTNNLFIIQEFLKLIQSDGEGYLDYYFPKPNETESARKRGFVKLYEPYQWVIGTGNYLDDIDLVINDLNQKQSDQITGSTIFIVILTLLLVAIGFGIGFILSGSITKPIKLLTTQVTQLGKLDLANSDSLQVFSQRKDEVGDIGSAVYTLSKQLKKTIISINDLINNLRSDSNLLVEVSEVTLNTADAVTRAVDEFSKGITEQASDSQLTVDSIHVMNRQLSQSSEDITKAVTYTIKVQESQEVGIKAVEQLDTSFISTQSRTSKLSSDIDQLKTHASEINAIVEMINGIAGQTNLLALNASIEAARAGEAGRGFAVVASEIRNLAEQTSLSTAKISDLIKKVTESINSSKTNMDDSSTLLNEAASRLVIVKETFSEILTRTSKAQAKMADVSSAYNTIDQSRSVTLQAVESISSVTEESAAAAEEINASMEEQKSMTIQLDNVVKGLSQQLTQLTEIVNQFKI
jgi:methyl-accepting chemotaxis protein